MTPVTPLLAAYADIVIMDALERFAPIALAMVAFGVVYWLFRRQAAARESQKRIAWLKDRKEKREGAGKPPAGS
jgi:cbb3-type cytochrome oxidase subunit 3